jgi:ATP-binding protein involved in chromosome partitioning
VIKNFIVVASGKGGVGKSTVAVNLAVGLAKSKNLQIGLLDADIYGPSIPKMLGIKEKPLLSKEKKILPYEKFSIKSMSIGNMIPEDNAVIWRGAMASRAIGQLLNDVEWGDLDYLIIDLPPGTGDIQLSLCQNLNINGAVIVSTPQEVSIIDVRKAIHMFKKVKVPILGIVQNMSYLSLKEGKKYIFGKNGALNESKKQKIKFLGEVPILQEISEASDSGEPLSSNHNSDVYMIFKNISKKLIHSISKTECSKIEIKS